MVKKNKKVSPQVSRTKKTDPQDNIPKPLKRSKKRVKETEPDKPKVTPTIKTDPQDIIPKPLKRSKKPLKETEPDKPKKAERKKAQPKGPPSSPPAVRKSRRLAGNSPEFKSGYSQDGQKNKPVLEVKTKPVEKKGKKKLVELVNIRPKSLRNVENF